MTPSKHPILNNASLAFAQRYFEVCWSSLVHARHDTFNDGADYDSGNGASHRRIDLVFSVQLLAEDHAIFEVWLEFPNGRRTILPRQPLPCRTMHDNSMLHVDCEHRTKRLLSVSLHDDGHIAYAQSDLLAEAGFTGGAYDPPTIRTLDAARDAASA